MSVLVAVGTENVQFPNLGGLSFFSDFNILLVIIDLIAFLFTESYFRKS